MFTPPRINEPELLDEHDAPRAEMERSLRDLRRINRWLGGIRIYRRVVRELLGDRSRATVLELGAGTADLLDSLPTAYSTIALDFNINHLLYLRKESRALRVVGDAARLPFRDGSVDVITSAHFFHHFSPEENVNILSDAMRVARAGVAINDTRRHYAPLLFMLLVGALRLVGRITAYDGPASVRRGYTRPEVLAIAERVPASRRRVIHLMPFRFGLLLWK
jgi:ubiquinone/menaquinone biosynthesis C-methylase UbiE